jgi:CubicO group peptidase (beta-lactamase class C family)
MTATAPGSDFSGVGRLLDRLVATQVLPGASTLVLKAGEEAFYHQAGCADLETQEPLTRDTIFRIFSMTKPVTAAAVMVLIDDGRLSLDDLVSAHIPEMAHLTVHTETAGQAPTTVPARPARIKDLLTHTAGFSYWFQPGSPVASQYDEVVGAGRFERWRFDPALGGLSGLATSLAQVPLVAQPGDRWHYSMSLEVAGIVIERVSGQTLDQFMQTRIFEPLGMADTGFTVAPRNAPRLASLYGPGPEGGLERLEAGKDSLLHARVPGLSGGGGLTSTLDDYARFAEMLRNKGERDGRRVLTTASAQQMLTNQLQPEQLTELPELAAFGLGGTGEGLGFGLGGAVALTAPKNGVPVTPGEYSWGGAASTTFWIDPKNQLTVIFMTQLLPPSPDMLRDQLHVAVYEAREQS